MCYSQGDGLNTSLSTLFYLESFHDRGGRGYDDSVPGVVIKTAPSGYRLHDPLHGREAFPEFTSFHQGVGKICPREGLFPCRPLPKRGQICDILDPANR